MNEREKLIRAIRLAKEIKRREPWRPLKSTVEGEENSPQRRAYESLADVTGYGGAAGGGKGLALDTPLPTPTGWVKMGDVRLGDVLFDEAGASCVVLAVSEINHRPCFRLTFDDGSSLVSDDMHRWVTFDAKELSDLTKRDPAWKAARRARRPSRAKGIKSAAFSAALAARNAARAAALAEQNRPLPTGTLRDTETLFETLRTPRGRTNHAIRVAGALGLPEVDLPIPPYTLGAWLGDGASRNGQLTGIDPQVWEGIGKDGFEVRHYAWDDQQHSIIGLKVKLRELGVLENKHIPPQYLRGSAAQRLALLQGLMDTDGHAEEDGGCEFCNTNEKLADGVLELALSLGIKATKRAGIAKLNGKTIGPKWRVCFTTSVPVFSVPRQLSRLSGPRRRTTTFRYLVSCEPVESVPTRCICVSSPSRQYLAGAAMIPTHNSDLICGLALTKHKRVLILRREKAQTVGIVQRLAEIIGNFDGYSMQKSEWKAQVGSEALIEFGGLDNLGDEKKWQGRPHDLLALDEATEIREAQARFVMGWVRTSLPRQRARTLMTFNPPTTAEGRWVIKFFAPWLDRAHPNPAAFGELRWFATIDGDPDVEVPDNRQFVLAEDGKTRLYDFDPADYKPEKIIQPMSRTFIPARVTDNPYYMASGYMTQLQSLPEPLRSQMLLGDFFAGIKDDPWQVVPTAWVEAAQARWKQPAKLAEMDALGVDVARGGDDKTILQARHGMWFADPVEFAGRDTPDGPTVAGQVVATARDDAPVFIDVIGVGSSPYDFLRQMDVDIYGVNVAEKSNAVDKSGRLKFFNLRSELWWRVREALDPANNTGICLPPRPEILADLTAPRWTLSGSAVKVESREDIIKRLGRSPDFGSAVILALIDRPKTRRLLAAGIHNQGRDYDPYA